MVIIINIFVGFLNVPPHSSLRLLFVGRCSVYLHAQFVVNVKTARKAHSRSPTWQLKAHANPPKTIVAIIFSRISRLRLLQIIAHSAGGENSYLFLLFRLVPQSSVFSLNSHF